MSGHPFNYRLDGTALVPTYADDVRLQEGLAGKRADMLAAAYKHGAYVADRHWLQARLMRLDVLLPGGTPTEIYTAKQAVERLLADTLPTLTRADPVLGDVECRVLVSDAVYQPEGPQRFQWGWPVWQLAGYWQRSTAASETDLGLGTTGTIGPFTPAGNVETEPVITITCQADGAAPAVEHSLNGDRLALVGSFVAGDVIVVDVPARRVTLNGDRARNLLQLNRGHWLALPHSLAQQLAWTATSGTWDVTTSYQERTR